jgi:ribosomal protein L5
MLKYKFLLKVSNIKNIHKVQDLKVDQVKVYSFAKKRLNYKKAIKLFSFLKIIFKIHPIFLRSKNFFKKKNIKKGYPVAVLKTWRKTSTLFTKNLLKSYVIPFLKNAKLKFIEKKENNCIQLHIKNPFIFINIQPFFLFFKKHSTITCTFYFKKVSKYQMYFILRYLQMPYIV